MEIRFPAGTKELEVSAQISVLGENMRHWLGSELCANIAQLAEQNDTIAQQQAHIAVLQWQYDDISVV